MEIIIQVIVCSEGERVEDGSRILEYSCEMPIGKNSYSVRIPNGLAVTGYSGTLLLDPEAFDLAGLIVRTDEWLLPISSACQPRARSPKSAPLSISVGLSLRPAARYNLCLCIEIHAIFAQRVQVAKK